MPPLVSIVVPSFQQARFLRAAVDSVLAQDYAPLEVLVVDGGSTDGSVRILEGYGDRIWYRSRPDGGQAQAINEGFRRSRGEIVAWLNSDDVYRPGAVRRAVEALEADPDAGMAYGEGELIDDGGRVLGRFPETVPFDLWRLLHVADYILQPTAFLRRRALGAVGLLDQRLHWGLDWELWMRIGRRFPMVHVAEVLAASRIHGETKTATGGLRRLRELHRLLRMHGVYGASPAGVAHQLTTLARIGKPAHAAVTADALAGRLPRPLRGFGRSVLRGAEWRLRRWLENAQGLWSDGMVGSVGHLWLPRPPRGTALRVTGRNLDLNGQVVGVRCGRGADRTPPLAPGQRFELRVPVAADAAPVRAVLACARTARVAPLDPRLGCRRAGWQLETRVIA